MAVLPCNVRCWVATSALLVTFIVALLPVSAEEDTAIELAPANGALASPLEMGAKVMCVLTTERRVQCWGNPIGGRLGNGKVYNWTLGQVAEDPQDVDLPVGVEVLQLSVGSGSQDGGGCVVLADGRAMCRSRFSRDTFICGLSALHLHSYGGPVPHPCVALFGSLTGWGQGWLGDGNPRVICPNPAAIRGAECDQGGKSPVVVAIPEGRKAVNIVRGATSCVILDNGNVMCPCKHSQSTLLVSLVLISGSSCHIVLCCDRQVGAKINGAPSATERPSTSCSRHSFPWKPGGRPSSCRRPGMMLHPGGTLSVHSWITAKWSAGAITECKRAAFSVTPVS